MFDIGWSELLVIAVVMIVVVGPKDLPKMLRTFGRTAAKLRAMAGDFQKQFNDALKEAELDDVKSSIDSLRSLNPMNEVRRQLNPFEQAAADVRSGVDNMMKPTPAPDPAAPASPEPQAGEPLKNGATAMPGANGPEAAPTSTTFPAMTDASVVAPISGAPAQEATPAKKTTARSARSASPKPAAAKTTSKPSPAAAKAAKPAAAKKAPAKSEAKPTAAEQKSGPKKATGARKTAGAAK
jgi:sec-independent protein translocase protein TatB